ncbi:hypothetical protein ACFP3V_29775, partial [Streptacidiphilus monticola]
ADCGATGARCRGPALGRRGAGRSGTCGSPLASAPQPGQETAPFTWRRQVGQKDVIGGFNSLVMIKG